MANQVDKAIERKMFAHEAVDAPTNCPQCKQLLVQEYGPYQIATRSGRQLTDEYAMSGDFGYLCPECATAVIHIPNLAEMLRGISMRPGWKTGEEFTVLGLVNLEAIPPEQSHIPLDDLDPYPFVPFHPAHSTKQSSASRKKRPCKPKPRRRR